ncbi:hypothetical protein [Paenibacillus ehimensis]|uniref:Phage protein n=1 Tax=Paenibacillus ehimensis TaxID=79264 RepID=A0ABT8VHV6_9BACL|nr:hypothetical protein [Paenibacillus ehimensis]MDO3680567.1 hypothetical protein [Paenibacillus ehimensis]
MRELNIGEKTVRVRATPLALLFYKQEFKSDLIGDLLKLDKVRRDPSQLDSVSFLQLIWAMAKADAYGKSFPSFVEWIASLDSFDLSDQDVLAAAMEEATSGFFRSGVKSGAAKRR